MSDRPHPSERSSSTGYALTMNFLVPALLILVGLTFFVSLKIRMGHSRGGITDRPAAPGTANGSAEDADGSEDRESFNEQIHDAGTR